MAHSTAPEGYSSNYSAILDLIRYGFALWTPTQMAVLLFHAERSTAWGKEADQHSESQAQDGIFNVQTLSWVRGPAGIGRSSWHRSNAELERTGKNPAGVLIRKQRTNRHGRAEATEWAIDWPAVKAAIEGWKRTEAAKRRPQMYSSESPTVGESLSQRGRVAAQSDSPTVGESKPAETPPLIEDEPRNESAATGGLLSHSGRDSLTLTLDPYSRSRREISDVIEQSTGERPRTDGLIDQIAEIARRLRLPPGALARWAHDFVYKRRQQGYTVTAGLLGKAAATDLIPWMQNNRRLLVMLQQQAAAAERKAAEPAEIAPPQPDPEFARELIKEIRKRKA